MSCACGHVMHEGGKGRCLALSCKCYRFVATAASLQEQITSTIIGRMIPPQTTKAQEIRARIIRQQRRIVDMGEQLGALMLALEAEEDFMAELLILEEKEFQERNEREEREAEEHEQAMVDRANAHVDPES